MKSLSDEVSYHINIKHFESVILITTVFFLYFPNPLLMGGLSHYIAFFGPF